MASVGFVINNNSNKKPRENKDHNDDDDGLLLMSNVMPPSTQLTIRGLAAQREKSTTINNSQFDDDSIGDGQRTEVVWAGKRRRWKEGKESSNAVSITFESGIESCVSDVTVSVCV